MVNLSSMWRAGFTVLILTVFTDCCICQQPAPIGEFRITPLDEETNPFVAIRAMVDLGGADCVFEVGPGANIDIFDNSLVSYVPFIKRIANRNTRY